VHQDRADLRIALEPVAKERHLLFKTTGGRVAEKDPENGNVELGDGVPERIIDRGVKERTIAVAEKTRQRVVEPLHLEGIYCMVQSLYLFVSISKGFLDIGQADKTIWIACDRLGKILGEIAVDMVVLQHGGADAGVVHLCYKRLGGAVHILQTRRQELHVVVLVVNRPFKAAHAADAEVDVHRPARFRRVICAPQIARFDDGVVARAAHGLVAVRVHGALLEEQMAFGIGQAASGGKRWEDMRVAV
jgi:hypothetical protein